MGMVHDRKVIIINKYFNAQIFFLMNNNIYLIWNNQLFYKKILDTSSAKYTIL